jgi:hypothetical protein
MRRRLYIDCFADKTQRLGDGLFVRKLAKKVEVAPFVGLEHMFQEERAIAAPILWRRRPECHSASLDLALIDPEIDPAGVNIELDEVTSLDQPEWTANRRLRGDMQDNGAVRRSAHPGVRDSNHVSDAGSQQFGGNRQVAPLGHAWRPLRAGILQDHDGLGPDIEGWIIDSPTKVVDVIEHDGGTHVFVQDAVRGTWFDHGSIRRKASAQHCDGATSSKGLIEARDHITVVNSRSGDILSQRMPGDGWDVRMQ